jgi:hypothetical protein
MTAMAIQIVTKPLPGADMKKIMGNLKEAADLFRQSGAVVSAWTVSVGEVGNLVFNARWDNFTSYGKSMDHMVGDQTVQAISAKITASGTVEWVRSNMVRELPI